MNGTDHASEPDDLEAGPAGEGEEFSEADAIEAALSALPEAGSYVQVYHKDADGDVKYLGQMDTAGFNLDAVRRKFGGGRRYVFDFYGKGKGKARVARQARRTMYIERLADERDAAAVAHGSAPPVDLHTVAQLVAEAQKPTLQALHRIAERLDRQPAPQSNATEMMTAMLSGLRDLHQLSAPPAAPTQAQPAQGSGDTLKEFRGLLQLAREFTGEGDGDKESKTLDFLGKAIDKIATPMVEAARSQANTQTPTAIERPEGQAQQAKANPMKVYVSMLMDSAARDEDPGNWVGLIVDRVPAEVLSQVLADPVGQLSQLDERAKTYETWVNELAGFIREEVKAMTTPEGDQQSGAGEGAEDTGQDNATTADGGASR